MSREPGFIKTLRKDFDEVMPSYQDRFKRLGGMTHEELVKAVAQLNNDPATSQPHLDFPEDDRLHHYEAITPAHQAAGEEMIANGEVAFVVLAGGIGTRLGQAKHFAKIPGVDTSMLAWKVMQGAGMPNWIMTGAGHIPSMVFHMEKLVLPPKTEYRFFEQFEGYRLTPDNRLAWISHGTPDMYPLGHGDVGPALDESGVLADSPAVKYVYIVNVDNVMASPHPGLLGFHKTEKCKITCEVVERKQGDQGGVVAYVNRALQVIEDWRLPPEFAEQAKWHNTNSMIIDVDVLKLPVEWRWHRVRKQAFNRLVVQYERLLQQYTEEYPTTFVRVPRDARYLGVKTQADLESAGKVLQSYRYL